MPSEEPGLQRLAASRLASVEVAGVVAAVVVEGAAAVEEVEAAVVNHPASLSCCLEGRGRPSPFLAGLHSDASG